VLSFTLTISMPTEIMAPLVYAGVNGLLDKVETTQITAWEKSL
jgi:F-type H+-transporting ATPase subunit alpha